MNDSFNFMYNKKMIFIGPHKYIMLQISKIRLVELFFKGFSVIDRRDRVTLIFNEYMLVWLIYQFANVIGTDLN